VGLLFPVNLAQIGKGDEHKMWKFRYNCDISAVFAPHGDTYTDQDEIKPVSIDHWPTVACHIWPRRGVCACCQFCSGSV